MKLRLFPAAMAATLCLVSTPTLLAAPFFNRSNPMTVRAAKAHNVSFQMRNGSAETLVVQAGEQQFTLKPGETVSVKVPLGLTLTSQTTTAQYAAGAALATVAKSLQGNTLVFN